MSDDMETLIYELAELFEVQLLALIAMPDRVLLHLRIIPSSAVENFEMSIRQAAKDYGFQPTERMIEPGRMVLILSRIRPVIVA